MSDVYHNKIVQAFRDNAIKSALFIDDEYLPYEELVKQHQKFQGLLEKFASSEKKEAEALPISSVQNLIDNIQYTKRSSTAAEFVSFFHDKKLICDVENQTNNLDKDKIRKSDLIILDYHLLDTKTSDNPAKLSLDLVRELSCSKHMNMVVIYTKEVLSDVWLELAATLRGSPSPDISVFLKEKELVSQWEEHSEDWINEWELITSVPNQVRFLLADFDIEDFTAQLQQACQDKGHEEPDQRHVEWLIEEDIREFNKNKSPSSALEVHGSRELWLQAGDVFIALCSKTQITEENETRDTTPEEVWQLIETALLDWYPSFYRVITSELQNQIEDANLSMEKILSRGTIEEISALWGVLRLGGDKQDGAAQELLNNLASDVLENVVQNSDFIEYVTSTANCINETMPEYIDYQENSEMHKQFQKDILALAYKNANIDQALNNEQMYAVAHAYNEISSTTSNHLNYITTGTVLKDENNSWYICVTPSCNTIPNQHTDRAARELQPHRQLTLARLKKMDNIDEALQNAHQSNYLFITDPNDKRLAFSVVNQESKLPDLVKVTVIEHDSNTLNEGKKSIVTPRTRKNKKSGELEIKEVKKSLELMALLRPAYAARYQNIQSHYEGRIGVDFATLNLEIPAQEE